MQNNFHGQGFIHDKYIIVFLNILSTIYSASYVKYIVW